MLDKIENSIALHQGRIKELKRIKGEVENSRTEKIRLKIETKHWCGYSEPLLVKIKSPIRTDKDTIELLLDIAIKVEQEKIDKLIDTEIEKRKENESNE